MILSKIEILKKDPSEKLYGLVLEYGHTFAHAIEWIADGKILHGEAVSIGMKMAAQLSQELNFIDQALVDLHYELIDDCLDFIPEMPVNITSSLMIEAMNIDNKKIGKEIKYIFLDGLGECVKGDQNDYLVAVSNERVINFLDRFIEQYRINPQIKNLTSCSNNF